MSTIEVAAILILVVCVVLALLIAGVSRQRMQRKTLQQWEAESNERLRRQAEKWERLEREADER